MARRILVAEDEPFIVESLVFLLSRAGHQVTAVGDGAGVLPAIAAFRPDLLILDIMLPTSNGFDILRRIRATPRMQHLPVLALTAKGQEADRSRMMELGVDDFVTKPFSNRDLMARVGRLLDAAVQHRVGQTDESA
jgi:DNA-binding response OmpR family regulator